MKWIKPTFSAATAMLMALSFLFPQTAAAAGTEAVATGDQSVALPMLIVGGIALVVVIVLILLRKK